MASWRHSLGGFFGGAGPQIVNNIGTSTSFNGADKVLQRVEIQYNIYLLNVANEHHYFNYDTLSLLFKTTMENMHDATLRDLMAQGRPLSNQR